MSLKNNKVIQKIAIALVCLLTINFIAPTYVSNASKGGVLFSPIKEFFVTCTDIALDLIDMGFTGKFKNVMQDKLEYTGGDNRFTDDDDTRQILMSKVSLESIFSNKVEFLNVDFINPIKETDYTVTNDDATSGLITLRKTISGWYVAIRNLSLVIMLSILVYVGIRIIICSVASEKAKYKQLLLDWVIGMCLLFTLHYIMAFAIIITEKITDMLSDATSSGISLQEEDIGKTKMLSNEEMTVGTGSNQITYKGGEQVKKLQNLTQYVRYYADLRKDLEQQFTFLIIYIFLVAYTVMFAVRYMKRMVIMAFLTIIAPFVAMTYPIDKMTDGKAQAFNFWLREYIFNLLIQPFHLVLFTLLVGTSSELASSNLIYALVAIGCLLPAEKLLKKMFGFDKAQTPPGLAGPAMATALANQLTGGAKRAFSGAGNSNASSGNNGNNSNTQQAQNTITRDYNFDSFNTDESNEDNISTIPSSGVENENYNENSTNRDNEYIGKNNNNNTETIDEDTRSMLNNNQNSELDAYLNSSAYGNEPQVENNDTTNSANNKSSIPNRAGNKLARGLSNVGKLGLHGVKQITKPKKLAKGARFVAKAGLGLAGMTAGATAGLVAGALTGKPGMVFAAMAGGAAMGGKIGSKSVDKALDVGGNVIHTAKNAKDSITNFKNEALYGGRQAYEMQIENARERERKEYAKNTENRNYFQEKTGVNKKKELDEIMSRAAEFKQMGAKDNDDVLKAMELEQIYRQDYKMSESQARQLAGISTKMVNEEGYSTSDFSDSKKRKAVENRTAKVVQEYAGNLSEKQQKQLQQQIMSGNEYMAGYKRRQENRMNLRKK